MQKNHHTTITYAATNNTIIKNNRISQTNAVIMRTRLKDLEGINPCNPPKDTTQEREYQMFCNIGKFLCAIGFTPALQGFTYLRQAIFFCILNHESIGTKRRFYEMLELVNAQLFTRIERSIRYSIAAASASGKILKINEFLGSKAVDLAVPPNNSEFIAISVEAFKTLMFK